MNTTYESHSLGFFGLSGILHAALAVFLMLFAVDMIKQAPKPEIIQFEVLNSPPAPITPTETTTVAPPKGEQLKTLARPEKAVKQVRPVAATKAAKTAVAHKAAPSIATPSQVSPLANLSAEDISVPVPALESADLGETPALGAVADLNDSDIADDLAKVEQESQKQTAAQLNNLRAEADSESDVALKEHQQKMAVLEKRNAREAQHLAALATDRQAREKAEGDARAQALAAAQAASARGAAERAAERAAEKEAAAEGARMAAQNTKSFGSENGVRALEDLRQKPGNKKPEYDQQDRYHQLQGEILFRAYVTKEGTLTQIKPMKLTGHRSLDLKTLKAIKEWKFYPGQEGWVEIPYIWSLKGEPQEMPGGLRTKVSQK